MRRLDSAIVLGAVLLLGGSLLLLQALSLLERATDIFWGSIFILGGLALLSLLRSGNWWPLLPGVSLLAVGALILLSDAAGAVYGGTVLLGGIAPAFWLVYLWDRSSHWWALIPAGALSTLAAVTLVSQEARLPQHSCWLRSWRVGSGAIIRRPRRQLLAYLRRQPNSLLATTCGRWQ